MIFPLTNGVLQGDLDADGFTILNLDLAGLNLTKASVGLGNVDNTSDANKPVSTAQAAAIALKQNAITLGTAGQYFRGDLSLGTLGALGLQGGATTLDLLSVIGANATSTAKVAARRSDWASTFADVGLKYYGASHPGSVLGLSAANAGVLEFINSSFSFITANGLSPLIFGYNSVRRMRLMTGLHVGGDTDPGAGCIKAAGDITGVHLIGTDLQTSGGATFNDDVIIAGGGSTLTVGGNTTVGGILEATLGLTTPSTIAGGGNMAVVGSIISFSGLPTSDPAVAGRLFRSGNDVKISTG